MADEFGPSSAFVAVGKQIPDTQRFNIVTGRFDFAADKPMPGKLYGRVLGSKYAHAKVTSIDTSKAEALDGVKAVITYKDQPSPADATWSLSATCLMVGQPIAAVAAVDEATAERALELIDVQYTVLNAVIHPEDALAPGAPDSGVFPTGINTGTPATETRGDIVKGFTDADVTIDSGMVGWVSRHTHNEIEPDVALAWWEGDDLFYWQSSQYLFSDRSRAASGLKLPVAKVHGHTHGTGGGNGGKGQTNQHITAALLAKKAGKPVLLQLPRYLYGQNRNHQWGGKGQMKLGAKNDGTLTAYDFSTWVDGGRNGASSNYNDQSAGTWVCPNYKYTGVGIATNKGTTGNYRGTSSQTMMFLSNLPLEMLGAKLKINPLDLRRKIFQKEPVWQPNGGAMCSLGVNLCMEKVATTLDFSKKWHDAGTLTLPDGRMHGVGITAHSDSHGGGTGISGAFIDMCADGTALINIGVTRVHGGPASHAAIVAETIGINYDDVRIGDWGNTDVAPEGAAQSGSNSTPSVGAAFVVAANEIRTQLFTIAAGTGKGMLNVKPADLDAKGGKIFLKADPTKFVTHGAAVALAVGPVMGKGVSFPATLRQPVGKFPIGSSYTHRTGCASAAEVAVDTDTGMVELLNWATCIDAGRVVDRNGGEAQMYDGQSIGINQALYWPEYWDPATGAPLNFDHVYDTMATTLDCNTETNNAFLIETIEARGPYGAHGIGEPSIIHYTAIVNAINNAINKWIIERPITPDVILKYLGKA